MERKKTSLMILGVCALVLSVIGVSYAFWQLRLQQTDENNLATSCFDVKLMEEENPIFLEKAQPIADSEGEGLTPFTFKLKNNCNANVKYQINLESLNEVDGVSIEDKRLDSKYIKEKLNEKDKDGSIRILKDNTSVEKTLDNAEESYKLQTGYMIENQEKTFELRLWLDGDLTMEDEEAMNKTFASKITIVATYAKEAKKTLEETILALEPEKEDNGTSGLYKVTHEDASITYTQDATIQAKLKQPEYRYAGKDPKNYVSFGEVATEDRYELILCLQGMCANLSIMPNFGVEEYYTDIDSCEAKKIDEELKTQIDGMASGDEYTLECKKAINLWRIIGLVNTPEGQKVKLIKDTSIGNYSWDTSASNANEGVGVNEWSQSDLMKLLNPEYENNKGQICILDESGYDVSCNEPDDLVNNSLYWNGKTGKCYTGESNTTTDCNFTNNSIPENLKQMIETVTWNTGSYGEIDSYSYNYIKVNEFYNLERSSNTGKICDSNPFECNDGVSRTTSWRGKVGLMYSSDYGYATSGGTTTTRSDCFETEIYNWNSSNECYKNDWLLPSSWQWTISPFPATDAATRVYIVFVGGLVDSDNAYTAKGVRPSVYLKPDVFVTQGNGSKLSPYVLEY